MAEQSYGDWIRSNPPLPTKEYKKEHMTQMKIFKELNKIGFKHYTENTIEELDNLPLDSEERIMEQSLVFLWFRKKYNLSSTIIHRVNIDDGGVCYDWLIIGQDVKYRHFDTYEEAELAAIVKLIEIVRKQKLNNKHMAEQNQIGDTDKMVTALEWLIGALLITGDKAFNREISLGEYHVKKNELYEQAKEMEKQQIKDAFIKGRTQGIKGMSNAHYSSLITEEEYYNQTFKKEHMAQSAVEWLIEELIKQDRRSNPNSCTIQIYFEASKNIVNHALEMNKHQHGNTWDAAIKAHDDRGHVHARSLVDFDEYFEETYKK